MESLKRSLASIRRRYTVYTCKWNPSKGVWHPPEGGTLYLCILVNGIPQRSLASLRRRYTVFMYTCKWNPSKGVWHLSEGGQCAKKVVSDSPGLVDFALGLVIFVLNLPDGQALFLREIQITEGL